MPVNPYLSCPSLVVVLNRVEVGFDYVVAAELPPESEEQSSVAAEQKGREKDVKQHDETVEKKDAMALAGSGGGGKGATAEAAALR